MVLLVAVGIGLYIAQPWKAAEVPTARTDADIKADVDRALASPELTQQAAVQAVVKQGVVTLTGTARNEYAAETAGALARGLAGVRVVVENRVTVAPTSAAGETGKARPSEGTQKPKSPSGGVGAAEPTSETAKNFQEFKNRLLARARQRPPVAELPKPPPFSVQDIVALLQGRVRPERVAPLVAERGVSFALTDAAEKRIRGAGGDDSLLLAIARAKK